MCPEWLHRVDYVISCLFITFDYTSANSWEHVYVLVLITSSMDLLGVYFVCMFVVT